jgi:MoaA/NifB/PqqE/SkfB family radical SAM enzyme
MKHQAAALKLRDQGDPTLAAMPHTIALAVNNTCFLRCAHCDVGSQKRSNEQKKFFYFRGTGDQKEVKEIPLEILTKLVDEVAPYNCVIRPTFLEPLLRKDLFTLASYVKSKGLTFNLQTNGVLLARHAREVVKSGIVVLRVSIDGPPHVHDQIRGVSGTFSKAIEGIRKVIGLKKEVGALHPVLGVSFAISGYNYNFLVAFMDYLAKEGLLNDLYISFSFLRFITAEEAKQMKSIDFDFFPITESSLSYSDKEKVDVEKLADEIEILKKKYSQDQYHYYFFPCELSRKQLREWFCTEIFMHPEVSCHVPWNHCQILYNGDVVFNGRCCSSSIGNIYGESFTKIWNGPKARRFREKLLEAGNFPACNRCCRYF